jgi:large subunit ribosomal protein L10
VVKNKLAAKSSEGTKVEAALQGLKGVNSVAYTSGDPVALAKALSTWVKDNSEYTFKLGIVDGKVITVAEIDSLAKLPGKEELFSKLLFLIQSPAQRLATVINATGRNLAVVVNMAAEQGKFGAPAAKAAPAVEAPVAEAPAAEAAAAHVEEASAGEQPSGAAEPENGTASQAGAAASSDPAEGSNPAEGSEPAEG